MNRDRRLSTFARRTLAAVALPAAVTILLLTGCGGLAPGAVSPLAGTWHGATRNPGNTFTGEIVFDYTGDLVSLDLTSPQQSLRLVFDGQPHPDDQDDTYSATARTTVTDDSFVVKGFVEYAEGKHEGLTYITVEGSVRYGSMEGTLTIAFPGNESILLYFDASRS